MENNDSIIKVKRLSKKFDKTVLNNISFELKDDEVLGIIGPSGGGKTTLLRILTGLESFETGEICIDGKRITPNGRNSKNSFNKIGLVFQDFNLFPHISILNNITMPMRIVLDIPNDIAEKKAINILSELGLEEKIYSFPNEVSGGQKQRVAIARMLCMDPEVIIFDEPTSALDPEWSKDISNLIKRTICEYEVPAIIVSHDISFAKEVTDRLLFIEDGEVVATGTYKSLIKNDRVKRFLDCTLY